jgi:hypothetical protein
MYIHGHAKEDNPAKGSPTYISWRSAIQRCHNTKNTSWKRYGARGIIVCDRWRYSFINFLNDMGERPPGTTLDRFPNAAGNYEPSNCRWATHAEQEDNKHQDLFQDSSYEDDLY